MTKLKPKLIIAGSNKKKGGFGSGFGYLLTLILVFAVGVYVGMKVDDSGFSRDQFINSSNDQSQTARNDTNEVPEVSKQAVERVSENSASDISSDAGTITKSVEVVSEIVSRSDQSEPEENTDTVDTVEKEQLQDVAASELSETDEASVEVANINELPVEEQQKSEAIGSQGPDEYRLQVAAFLTLDDANEEVAKLRDKGYDAYTLTATNSRGEEWILIKVGKFETAREAWSFSAVYKSREGVDAIVESSQRGRVYKESLGNDIAEE